MRWLGWVVASATLAASVTPGAVPAAEGPGFVVLDPSEVLAAARSGSLELALPLGTFQLLLVPNPIALGAVWGLDATPMGVVDEVVTFKGTANGYPVRLAATAAGVFAVIFAPDPIHIEPAWLVDPAAPLVAHRVVLGSQHPTVIRDEEWPASDAARPVSQGPATSRVARLLIESDFTFYDRFSLKGTCQACWVQVQQAILNVAEELFESQTGVSFQITSQWACRTVAACPYPGILFNIDFWLQAFQERWEGFPAEPAHELGHLLVATNLPVATGVAHQAAVGTPRGYALSEIVAADGAPNLGPLQYAVPAHEIGHNFDGSHLEADPIPPVLVPTGATGRVWTIMAPGQVAQYQFSDGSWDPTHNNAARIRALAGQRLPAAP